jgi:16S rRNA (guanine966-N2)-methyltransferase
VRVIGGVARGRPLRAPRGLATRPTSDLLRGVIFSMIASMGLEADAVLDLYAGTGALGIEALSRGASRADFVERSPAACAAIRANLVRTGFEASGRVICAPIAHGFGRLTGPYDVIFIDPPYADHSIEQLLAPPVASALREENTLLVYEHSRKDPPPATLAGARLLRSRSHGNSTVSFYAGTGSTGEVNE